MNYHVHHEGRDLGVFSREELQQRREFSGAEYVWRPGMTDWQPLDSVLQADAVSPPPPLPVGESNRRSRRSPWIITAVCAVAVLGVVLSVRMASLVRRARIAEKEMSGADGIEVSTQKVTWKTNTATYADAQKRGGEFRTRQWLEGYRANADHERPCDAEALQMIEAWIAANFGEAKTNAAEISQWCDKLAAMPECDDPLVLTITGLNSTEQHEKNRRLERALAAFPKSRHKAYPRLNALVNLIGSTDDTNRLKELFRPAIQAMNECFTDGSFRPDDQAEIAEIFINGWGYNFLYRARQSVYPMPRAGGKSFEWLTHVFEGEYRVMEAWKERGGGFAPTVSEKGWEGFATHSAAARNNFTRAWELRQDLPLAPSRMIYVAMGDSGAEEMRVWFDRTIAAQVDYPKAWSEMRWGLRPRWHGSLEAMLALGKTAVDTGRFDTDVPRKFLDLVSDLESELKLPFGEHLHGRPDIWPECVRMYEGYIAAPSQEKTRAGWRSAFASVAYLAGKYDVARAQLEAVNWQPWPYNLSGWGTDLSLMSLEVAARTGSAAERISAAESSYRKANVSDALKRYQELAGSTDLDSRTTTFARHRVAALESEKRLASGEWIDLLPSNTNDPAWNVSYGTVRRTDRTLEIHSDKFGHMLFSRARVGLNFEVRGEFELVKSSNGEFQAGLVMGLPNFNTTDWYSFRMKRNRDEGEVASFATGWSKQQVASPVALSEARNSFQFQFQNGEVTASVNGKQVLQQAKLPGTLRASPSEFLAGLGAYNDMNETTLRYHQVQLRRLTPARPAQQAGASGDLR